MGILHHCSILYMPLITTFNAFHWRDANNNYHITPFTLQSCFSLHMAAAHFPVVPWFNTQLNSHISSQ